MFALLILVVVNLGIHVEDLTVLFGPNTDSILPTSDSVPAYCQTSDFTVLFLQNVDTSYHGGYSIPCLPLHSLDFFFSPVRKLNFRDVKSLA